MSQSFFKILDAQDSQGRKEWLKIWEHWPEREVYAHPDYIRLYLDDKNRGCCAIFNSNQGQVFYPFICRDLAKESFGDIGVLPLCDIITPYGYGGPFVRENKDSLEKLAAEFWQNFDLWASQNNIVTEVIKFNLFTKNLLPYFGEKEEKLQNIIVDLERNEKEIWMSFAHKIRKNVNKAKRQGVSIIVDSQGERLNDFLAIYYNTLERRQAKREYYFSESFFRNIHRSLLGNFIYFYALHENKAISAELILVSGENLYSFLGGTYLDKFYLSPNDLLKYEIIIWGKKQQKKYFILGGGYQPRDGIYRYKRSFAPQGSVPFFIGHRILRRDLYNLLLENKRRIEKQKGITWSAQEGFIPGYRT